MFAYCNQNTTLSADHAAGAAHRSHSRRLDRADRLASESDEVLYRGECGMGLGGCEGRDGYDGDEAMADCTDPRRQNPADAGLLGLRLSESADHLHSLLAREARDYSLPLPARYYPAEFIEDASGSRGDKKTSIGPWRKRIASWMYDVVDHFRYDRNVVGVALTFIDRYVGHLLVQDARRDGSSSSSGSSGPVKRRHFQLIAVTSLYLAIKVHGELCEDDPTSGEAYDVIGSLEDEVEGRAFLGRPLDEFDGDDGETDDEDDDLRELSSKINELKRKQKRGRLSLGRLFSHGSACGAHHPHVGSSRLQPARAHSDLPYKPRKRGMLSGPLRLVSFVELSRGLFTAKDITDTERKILVALNYVVNPPTSRRFVGELLRILALTHGCEDAPTPSTRQRSCPALPSRRSVLSGVLSSACSQIERASSVLALSLGTGPSVVAYAAFLNAVEDEFDAARASVAASPSHPPACHAGDEAMEDASARLEDFQRHYRRFSRASPATTGADPLRTDAEAEEAAASFLDAWKAHFLVEVYHASECYLSPDDQGILDVRDMLLDECIEGAGGESSAAAASSSSPTSSPRGRSAAESKGKRSPRSPRSVTSFGAGGSRSSSRHFRGSSFFAGQQQAQHSRQGSAASASLFSPYESDGRLSSASAALVPSEPLPSSSASGRAVPSAYTRQASLPARGGRCTPEVTRWGQYAYADPAASRRTMEFEQQPSGWESGRPAFFSA